MLERHALAFACSTYQVSIKINGTGWGYGLPNLNKQRKCPMEEDEAISSQPCNGNLPLRP